jgi:hypothetical protein
MAPTKLMIIRHAEKPGDGKPFGVRARGERDDKSLTTRGWQRAGALARFFAPLEGRGRHPALAAPNALVAAGHRKAEEQSSRRSPQTLRPLSQLLGLTIDDRFSKGHEADMMKAALARDGVVLIAWAHEFIPAILANLPGATATPKQWPDDRFDLVWILDRSSDAARGSTWTFTQAPQLLLGGDKDELAPMS